MMMESELPTNRTEEYADGHEDELQFGGETERQEVEDLPNYGDNGSGAESGSDDDLKTEGCDVCNPETEETETSREAKTTWTEQVQMIHLRRYIDQLAEKVKEKDYLVAKTREEYKKCNERIEQLEYEKQDTIRQIQNADSTKNTSANYRLRAQYERIGQEMENENDLKVKIKAVLDNAEYELSQAQVEQGKYILKEDELQKREEKLRQEKADMAQYRNNKEQKYAENYVKQTKKDQRLKFLAYEEQERSMQHALYQAEKSQERHSKHLSRTVSKIKQREQEEQERHKAHMQRRMETMLTLKKDIAANRENLRSLQARDRAMVKKAKQKEEQTVQDILAEGGNPSEELIKKKKMEEFEKEKQLHVQKQRQHQVEIAAKILQEEERIKRRKEQQPQLWENKERERQKIVKPHKKRKLRVFDDPSKDRLADSYEIDYTKFEGRTGDESDEDDNNILTSTLSRDNTYIPDSDSDHEDTQNMAKPEFEGMWDSHKPYEVPKDVETGPKLPGASKMEKEIMTRVLERHKENIVIKQVAAGREFKGYPFYSKPSVVHFKDFDVGKTYKKKVILTNVSYSVNYCKLLGITEHLKDFIHIHFDPPGQMSAGLTCEMLVTFKPMINEDLQGEVSFLAQTGPFTIPLICTTKKCDLKVDSSKVDFGTSVIGETLKRSVTLSNNGALATNYEFFKLTGLKQRTLTTAETSLGRLTTADTMRNVSPDSEDVKEGGKSKPGDKGKKKETVEEEKKDEEKPTDDAAEDGATKDGEDAEDEDIPDIDGGSSMAVDHMEDLQDLDGMRVSGLTQGELAPFSSVKLDIVWQPTIPGKVDVEFAVSFSDPDSENINISSVANAIDVPVWVERQNVDLKICMFDRLYQDTIIVNNRATTALRLKFEVCKELRNHLELLPKTGYIQAQSQFSAQLKFLPRKSLVEEAGQYFDRETGVLEAPMIITVADQTRPVPFSVHAVVTNSDLEFDMEDIDFGCCTIYEAVKKTIKLSNKSILSQQFGFLGLPDYVDVQPNDGFGTLLPLETIEMDIIFQPKKAGDFKFELTCKSLINRTFKLQCEGVAVHPPLELSHQVIHFAATTLNDVSTASVHVINPHTSMNEFSHPVPRIGKGEIAPVGPTSFEFVVPKEAPFTISPSVGTVQPGEKCRVQVRFTPTLSHEEISKEAVRMISKQMEIEAHEEWKRQQLLQQQEEAPAKGPAGKGGANKKEAAGTKPPGKSSAGKKGKNEKDPLVLSVKGPQPIQPPEPNSIDKGSNEYSAAHASLLRQFRSRFQSFTVPCYIASGKCANPRELQYSVHNTLYMDIHCPAIRPQLVVISDNGRTTTDFGDISIGQSVIKSVTIQNISDKHIDLHSSILDPEGPFLMLNALRLLPPDASHTLLICFTPHKGAMFQEVLEILAPTSTLHITLKGKGVSPMINLSVKDGMYDMGSVISGEYREDTFKIENTSSLSIEYCIKLDSQSLLRYSKAQGLPQFVKRDAKALSYVGTQNNNGQQVFDCVPANGIIPKAGTVEITVTFAPDHPSDYYADGVRIDLFGQEEQHVFRIKATAKPHIMYLDTGTRMSPDVESLAVLPVEDGEESEGKAPPVSLLVTVKSVARETEYEQGSTEIYVGCVRTMAVSQKKNGEWQFDNLTPIQQLGFNVDQPKGMLEAGTRKPVTITWTPPAGYDPNKPMETSVNVTLRGDIAEVYRLILKGFVVSE